MTNKLTTLLALLVFVSPCVVEAQSTDSFPSVAVNAQTLRVQNKAEELFEERNYDRAFFIYRNELAPIGDKYAQYMVGYMYLTGKGVEPDRVTATAWYRLAAERGTKEFIKVRDQFMVSLTPEQVAECDRKYVAIRKQYSDLALLMQAARADFAATRGRTGSRLSGSSGSVVVIDMGRPAGPTTGLAYYGEIEDRLQAKLDFILDYTNNETLDRNVDSLDMALIERLVNDYLEVIE
jgi:hypothetical protein